MNILLQIQVTTGLAEKAVWPISPLKLSFPLKWLLLAVLISDFLGPSPPCCHLTFTFAYTSQTYTTFALEFPMKYGTALQKYPKPKKFNALKVKPYDKRCIIVQTLAWEKQQKMFWHCFIIVGNYHCVQLCGQDTYRT